MLRSGGREVGGRGRRVGRSGGSEGGGRFGGVVSGSGGPCWSVGLSVRSVGGYGQQIFCF